jgi:hypothetical protein
MCPKSQNRPSITFSEIEELEEAAQSIGWDIDYRQISKGNFSASSLSWTSRKPLWRR